ncbi:glycosyltransferase [Flavobacterium psychrotolerans]|uniref:Glycosyltransferase 2-like domain-containing protein n=1 Tax=Flavobacterium psychrotolerans TaxID=2169410 RepID=A0A2U1JI99_9FLAO|nr:glycosyltransferase [Flavobacterium psychrotolerans]PWA04862.1 hypothetical protein DB895_08835 [Flavobacterium psychrotolerans]
MAFFSIIIPCYNQAHFLPDCLDSLLVQNYQDWEAIVINDGSTDGTSEITNKYVKIDSRIKLIEKENGGLSSARNHGIRNAIGERFIFLDSDDFLYPNCLEKVAFVAKESNDNELIQYGYTYITEGKERILGHVNVAEKKSLLFEIFKGNLGPCHSICISKELVHKSGFFDETLKSAEDWDFWIRAVKVGGSQKAIQESLVYYRYSFNSMSRNPFIMYDALKTVIQRAHKKDTRISIESPLNIDYKFDAKEELEQIFIRTLGVSIMQNRIEESITFFHQETAKSLQEYNSSDFEAMCSYLSFRYWYSRDDIEKVFSSFYPQFLDFFDKMGYGKTFRKKALNHIFKRHIYYRNIYRFGKIQGSFFNFILRNIRYV